MADRIADLFQEWHKLGGAVLLARADATLSPRAPEQVIAESTAYCRDSGRLTWIVLDWLVGHIDQVDEQLLLRRTEEIGDLSVLGVLCDTAYQRNPHPRFQRIARACPPHDRLEPFFHRVARSPLATRLTQEQPLAVFLRWNYLCNELRHL
ncbi:MAG: hypothetical protein KKA73_18015 [Chloroflexi bacterium]|nr:hypothetical protein [Chloroflexota bacterium]MBU1749584.1 hypothetical protein [Chloroflexota bacterium]